jgi:hypothetical protein
MNIFRIQDSNGHPAKRVKLDETGSYLGIQYLKARTRFVRSHSRASSEFKVEIGTLTDGNALFMVNKFCIAFIKF